MNRPVFLLLVAAAVVGCDSGAPAAPSPVPVQVAVPAPPPAPPPSPIVTYSVSGLVVDSDGAPVPEAEIKPWVTGHPATLSDRNGAYTLSAESHNPWLMLTTTKPGYEPGTHFVPLEPPTEVTKANLRLHRIVSILAGESVEMRVDADDSTCGLELEWKCRRIRVRSNSPGMLRVEILPNGDDASLSLAFGSNYYPFVRKSSVTAAIAPNLEIPVDILTTRVPVRLALSTTLD